MKITRFIGSLVLLFCLMVLIFKIGMIFINILLLLSGASFILHSVKDIKKGL